MASSASASSQNVTLPLIPELYDPNYLDTLLPSAEKVAPVEQGAKTPASSSNPMMDALKANSHRTFTANGSPAYNSTLCATLDAFQTLSYSSGSDIAALLEAAWKEDANLTLRLIWNIRSIRDGQGEKEVFYQAFGWLYEHHPRTAIRNIHLLVEPLCTVKKGSENKVAHGYWKDLSNIVALAAVDQLRPLERRSTFLHRKIPRSRGYTEKKTLSPEARELRQAALRAEARRERTAANDHFHQRLLEKLREPRFRALYITVARLYAERLVQDIHIHDQMESLPAGPEYSALSWKLSLAGKWAPTPGLSHDRPTNLSTAIALLVYQGLADEPRPVLSVVPEQRALPAEDAHVVRSFYRRWVLTPLRRALLCPEPLMSSNRWTEIVYTRVPSICMKLNTPHFLRHDPVGFEKYILAVESGNSTITGATLMPHELLVTALSLSADAAWLPVPGKPSVKDIRARAAETQLRTIELQWRTMVDHLRQAGSLDNSLAICDVSGSMGTVSWYDKDHPSPLWPAVALSLVLAQLSKPPFANSFITFSSKPEFVQLDPSKRLHELFNKMVRSSWSMNTNFNAVFLDLLLPLAIKHNVKQEDMIKRLFVFSDMQFDDSLADRHDHPSGESAERWATNHDVIERAFKEAGYELPEIVYWNLASAATTPVLHDRKGVALMSGFSPSMLKVFMGETEVDDIDNEWEAIQADEAQGGLAEKQKEEFSPVNVMKKALAKESFQLLVVVD